ncbi:hypothetical protein SASPL_128287 [Salvia splendens]|uniref:K-box domain-containing protein n=2 Tax=Salvia splendens TaxID=180675 RepID=A0A8X8ZNC2_SALSN|nr:hypothetical protein SASPL_128287 [Salvia splendens]
MERILERYERHSYAERQLKEPEPDSPASWSLEHAKLKARMEVLQRNQRHYMGEDLDTLSMKELQNLEHQLDDSLKHIRRRKNQLMNESISELQKKDKALQEQNNILAKKIKEREKETAAAATMEQQQNHNLDSSGFGHPHHMGMGSFNHSNEMYQVEGEGAAAAGGMSVTQCQNQFSNPVMPPWMLRS